MTKEKPYINPITFKAIGKIMHSYFNESEERISSVPLKEIIDKAIEEAQAECNR